jgi:hypothetical protein
VERPVPPRTALLRNVLRENSIETSSKLPHWLIHHAVPWAIDSELKCETENEDCGRRVPMPHGQVVCEPMIGTITLKASKLQIASVGQSLSLSFELIFIFFDDVIPSEAVL